MYTDKAWTEDDATSAPTGEHEAAAHVSAVEPVEPEAAPEAPAELTVVADAPVVAASRVLDVAVATADQLVADAQAEADELRVEIREETERVATELTRLREEQIADLHRERTAALSELADQKAALEAQVATLRQQEADCRSQLRGQLHEHLALLGDAEEPSLSVVG